MKKNKNEKDMTKKILMIALIAIGFTSVCNAQNDIVDSVAFVSEEDQDSYSHKESLYKMFHNPEAENVALNFINALIGEDSKKASMHKSNSFNPILWQDVVTFIEGDLEVEAVYWHKVNGLYLFFGIIGDYSLKTIGTYAERPDFPKVMVKLKYTIQDFNDMDKYYFGNGYVDLIREGGLWKVVNYKFLEYE